MAIINGTSANDTIRPAGEGGSLNGLPNATDTDDTINGLAGNDLLSGGDGNDTIDGGAGEDTLRGGSGDDTLVADTATSNFNDYLFGGDGNDTLRAPAGNPGGSFNFLFGGPGNDTIDGNLDPFSWADYADRALPVVVDLSAGTAVVGGTETDTLVEVRGARGGAANDVFTGTAAFELFAPGLGDNIVNGNGGDDYLLYGDLAVGVDVDLAAGTAIHLADGSQDALTGTFQVVGTTFADTLRGDSGNNVIRPLNGIDLVDGRDGFDTVRYSTTVAFPNGATIFSANDPTIPSAGVTVNLVSGTAIDPWGFTDTLVSIEAAWGTFRDDTMTGNDVANRFTGVGGNDLLRGGGGNDALDGGDGNDRLEGEDGNDALVGGLGDDTLRGGAGIDSYQDAGGYDTIEFNDAGTHGVVASLTTGLITDQYGNAESIGAVNDFEYLIGSSRDDDLEGKAVTGNIAQLTGLAGNDTLRAGNGVRVVASYQLDPDSDGDGIGIIADLSLATGQVTDGFGGTDTLVGFANVRGSTFDDILLGNDSDNWFRGEAGDDTIEGRGGFDIVNYANSRTTPLAGISATLTDGAGQIVDGLGGTDTVSGIEQIDGSRLSDTILITGSQAISVFAGAGDDKVAGGAGNDTLFGDSGNDRLFGGAGDDTASGGDANDRLLGEAGADNLSGDAGNDIIYAGTGNDTLHGGTGSDTLAGEAGEDTIAGGDGNDKINGGADNDTLGGDGGNDNIQGGDGGDRIEGGDGNDFLFGQAGNDVISGDAGNDQLFGDAGDDDLYGAAGDDIVRGGSGNNRIDGGAGLDMLFGGADSDTFVLARLFADRDWISGFTSGTDFLEVDAVLFGLAPGALDPSRLVANANPVATAPGQFLFDTDNGTLRFDADGAGGAAAETIARLIGVSAISAGDFIIV